MGQITIKRLMIVVGVAAILLAVVRALLPSWNPHPLALVMLGCLGSGLLGAGVGWLVLRRRPRLAAWSGAGLGGLANAGTALIIMYLTRIEGDILVWLLALLTVPPVALAGTIGGLGWRRGGWPGKVAAVGLAWTLAGFPFVTMSTRWPLRLAFALSEPAMNRLADRVAAGQPLQAPEWVGLYRVVATIREPSNGNIALIIDADPAGRSAFTRVTDPEHPYLPLVNFNFDEPVGPSWRYQNED